jgi:hypothetical protein
VTRTSSVTATVRLTNPSGSRAGIPATATSTSPSSTNLSDLLWVLADGLGPMEVVEHERYDARPNPALTALAERHATTPRRSTRDIVTAARSEFPTFSEDIDALCR